MQGITTAVNHTFNSSFAWLSTLPSGLLSDLIGGTLVLIRRALFFVPEGVTASQVGTSLNIDVDTGSVAYLRQDGSSIQISGDPWFFGAMTFSPAAGVTVAMTNPGDAGCAGAILQSGQIEGNMRTSQIDSLRFGSDASVTGTVSASVVNGRPLTVTDAVRGQLGVVLDAPVVLANNVEVDAGTGNATFTSTVDATATGKQSLTVTALGNTTFAAAVGGRTPLSSLLTQGIAPLDVPQSADSLTIPLRFLPQFSTGPDQGAQVKYGIDVAIGNNPSQVYEFDTGGVSFFAGYNPALWSNVPLTATPVTETYSSGIYYNAVVANTRITLGQGTRTVSTAQPIQIAAILSGGNSRTTPPTVFDFTNPAAPPVEDRFFGDFGASFATTPVAGLATPLANPLFQLPGNLSSGFLVQVGPIGVTPQLTVGVTDELRAQFPYAIPVTPQPGGGTYPVSGYDVLSWFGFSPSYSATVDGVTQQIGVDPTLPSLIDSGAPSTGIRIKGLGGDPYNQGGELQLGALFTAEFPTTMGRPALQWTFVAGKNGSVDLVQYQQGAAGGVQNVNTGLNLYNSFDVMFDVAEQVIWLRPTGGQSTVSVQSVTTTGAQTYRQNANLAGTYTTGGGDFSVAGTTRLLGNTVVDVAGGSVTFSGTVDGTTGAESLRVNAGSAATFVREVGFQQTPASLSITARGPINVVGVNTGGSQAYNGDVSLAGFYTAVGSFTVSGATTLAAQVGISGADISFGGPIDSTPQKGYQLALTTAGTATLGGAIGGKNALGGLSFTATGATTPTVVAPGYISLNGGLGFSATDGLTIGNRVNATLSGGGIIQGFSGSGVVIGESTNAPIRNFVITGNGGGGVQINGSGATITNNSIQGNTGAGVAVTAGNNNQILSNSIFGNSGAGISLSAGTNNSIVAPTVNSAVLTSAGSTSSTLTVQLAARPAQTTTFQVFYTPAGGVGPVQGQQLLTTVTAVPDAGATWSLPPIIVPADVAAGGFITVTATRNRDTSEFSNGRLVTG